MKKLTTPNPKPWQLLPCLLSALVFSAPTFSAPPIYKTPLNDTGATNCVFVSYRTCLGEDQPPPGLNVCTSYGNRGGACTDSSMPEDARFGRDRTQNDRVDGHAGFSFTKISKKGVPLPPNARVWSCVKDNVTGLMWEVKTTNKGLHDRRWTYSWFESRQQLNGGNSGVFGGGKCPNKSECDTYHYPQIVNQRNLCGYDDWRIPSINELVNLSLFNQTYLLDPNYFPDAKKQNFTYWSATSGSGDAAWYFGNSDNAEVFDLGQKSGRHHIRLVRGGQ